MKRTQTATNWSNGGLLSANDAKSSSKVREKIHSFGYEYKDHGGMAIFGAKDNEYFNKNGESVTREDFWKNFKAN